MLNPSKERELPLVFRALNVSGRAQSRSSTTFGTVSQRLGQGKLTRGIHVGSEGLCPMVGNGCSPAWVLLFLASPPHVGQSPAQVAEFVGGFCLHQQ